MPNYKIDIGGAAKAQSGFFAFVFFVLSVVALYLPAQSQDEVALFLRGSVLRPFILTEEALARRSIHAEDTEALQARLDSLQIVIFNSRTLSEENAQLRSLHSLSERSSARYVAAELTSAGESMFQLTAGIRQGVTSDSPVRTARGLLGVVRRAGTNRATGWDWTHPQFRASAVTEDGSVAGLIRAVPGGFREADRMLLDGVPFQEELEPGMLLVTSGLGVVPRGIPIGVVLAEADARQGWSRSYWLQPSVSPGEASHVYVLVAGPGESGDASSWLEDGAAVPRPAVAEEFTGGTADTEVRTRQ